MKKNTFYLALTILLFSLKINAQNERLLLLESFTNTSCGYCGMYNPAMDALIAANPDKIAAIKYHVSWPSNQDPMYLHNTSENNSRTNYYGVSGVPFVVIDGNHFSGGPNQVTQNIINQQQSITSPLEMRLSYELNEAENTITVHVMGHITTDIEGSCKLYVGVIEKEIHFNFAPGNNGERDFYSVMKKLLPSANGTNLGELAEGNYFAYNFTWELANVYNNDQLDAIAWVQNQNTKEVYQTCKSSQELVPFFDNEACVSDISNVKSVICSGEACPRFLLTNYGGTPLTSAEVEVLVNGESLKTMEWNGNLDTFESETVDLGEVGFTVNEDNFLEVRINSVNGGIDGVPDNNLATFEFDGAPDIANKVLTLTVRTDGNPQETTWKVTQIESGEVVLEGGPYDTPNHTYTEILEIPNDGCYDFTIYDAGGNGFSGSGIYGMKAGSTTLFHGKVFGDSESNEFSYEITDSTEEPSVASTSIFPNPTTGMVNILTEGEQMVTIYNMVGQRVFEVVASSFVQIDMKAFGTGIYVVKVGKETQRIVVE